MIKVTPRYEDNKTYPILVKYSEVSYKIVEMLGKTVNEYNNLLPKYIRNPFTI